MWCVVAEEWETPVFQNSLRPSAAFIAHSPFPQEEPPPYSKELLEGHITLMRGAKPRKEEDDLNTSLLTAGDISMWTPPTSGAENPTQTTDISGEDFQDELALSSITAAEVSEQVPFTTSGCREQPNYSDRYNIILANTVPHARPSILPNPFVENSSNIAPPPLAPIIFQRPLRSISTDRTVAESVEQASDIQRQTTQFSRSLSIDDNIRQSFPTRPLHLPPLRNNSAIDQPNQHRKKSRRRRGHSWHGDTQELTVNSSAMVTVTE